MFTSRAEYRLQLREDNADLRLTEIGHELGVVPHGALRRSFCAKREAIERETQRLRALWAAPSNALGSADRAPARHRASAAKPVRWTCCAARNWTTPG